MSGSDFSTVNGRGDDCGEPHSAESGASTGERMEFVIGRAEGCCARISMALTTLLGKYRGDVTVRVLDRPTPEPSASTQADGKSMLDVLMMAMGGGTRFAVEFSDAPIGVDDLRGRIQRVVNGDFIDEMPRHILPQ